MSRGSFLDPAGGWLALLAFLAILLVPAGLSSQESREEFQEELKERINVLFPRMEELREISISAREALDRRRMATFQENIETTRVGPFRVAARPDQIGLARGIFQDVWEEFQPLVEGSEALASPYLFVVRYDWDRVPAPPGTDSTLFIQAHRRFSRRLLFERSWSVVRVVFGDSLPREVARWSAGFPSPRPAPFEWAARDLIASPSRAARACYQGDPSWCWEALGAVDTVGARERWYTPDERRLLVEEMGPPAPRSRDYPLWEACLRQESQRACDLLLDRKPLPIPLTTGTRQTVLDHALRMGGKGALERLQAQDSVPVPEALAAAAGVHPDSLAASWRRKVLRSRPSAWAGLGLSPLGVLVWFLIFAAFAARSTRWRLG